MPQGIWLASYVALWFLLGITTVLLVATMRQVRQFYSLYVKSEPSWGLPIGAVAPQLSGMQFVSEAGNANDADFLPEKGKLNAVFFLSPGCSACQSILPQLNSIGRVWKQANHFVVVPADVEATRRYVSVLDKAVSDGSVGVLSDAKSATARRYNIQSVPYLVVIGNDGKICAKGSAATRNEVETALAQAAEMYK